MERDVRLPVPALTALLTAISLALVFGAVLGAIPTSLIPRWDTLLPLIPHANAVVCGIAIVGIVAAWRAIRRGDVRTHRALMLTSLALFAVFLALYLYKVVHEGPAEFPGPAAVYRFVYLPTLAVHISLAVVCIPLLYYVALLGLTRPVEAIYETRHRVVGRVAATLWLTSFSLGEVVYGLLYVVY